LARALSDNGVDAVFSYAGRTGKPVTQPLPTRIGGFGGAEGLAHYLSAEGITHLVDATHPFAAGMNRNAIAASAATGVPLLAFERPPWSAGPGDDWRMVADTEAAVAALPDTPARVFLAIGKQTLAPFAVKPQHHYLLRLVDPPEGSLPLPDAEAVIARGPFSEEDDLRLLTDHGIGWIVAKNSGGAGAEAKLLAARKLGLPVVMIDRPKLPGRATAGTVGEVMEWIGRMGNVAHPTV